MGLDLKCQHGAPEAKASTDLRTASPQGRHSLKFLGFVSFKFKHPSLRPPPKKALINFERTHKIVLLILH